MSQRELANVRTGKLDRRNDDGNITTVTDSSLKQSFLGLDLRLIMHSGSCPAEQRSIRANLLDAFATAVCAYSKALGTDEGLILRCDRTVFTQRPHTRLRAWTEDEVQLPIRRGDTETFGAWTGWLRVCAQQKGFQVGLIYWPKGVANIELVLDIPALEDITMVSELRIGSLEPDLKNRARSVVHFLCARDGWGKPQ